MKKKISLICIILITIISFIAIVIIYNINFEEDSSTTKSKIIVSIFDKENNIIYKENIETDEIYLINVLKNIEKLNIVTEESKYGEYITSIMGIKQGDNFYWNYYINNEYANVGVSNCKIQTEKEYNFKIESINY